MSKSIIKNVEGEERKSNEMSAKQKDVETEGGADGSRREVGLTTALVSDNPKTSTEETSPEPVEVPQTEGESLRSERGKVAVDRGRKARDRRGKKRRERSARLGRGSLVEARSAGREGLTQHR